jgi:hypothetical protein
MDHLSSDDERCQAAAGETFHAGGRASRREALTTRERCEGGQYDEPTDNATRSEGECHLLMQNPCGHKAGGIKINRGGAK